MNNIENVVSHFKNQNRMAIVLGVTRQAVNHWVRDGHIPPASAVEIERLTNGEFKAIDLVKEG